MCKVVCRTPDIGVYIGPPHTHDRIRIVWDPSPRACVHMGAGCGAVQELTPSTGLGVRGRGWVRARCHVPGGKLCHVLTSVPIPDGGRAGHDFPGDPQARDLPARGERVRQAGAAGTAPASSPSPIPWDKAQPRGHRAMPCSLLTCSLSFPPGPPRRAPGYGGTGLSAGTRRGGSGGRARSHGGARPGRDPRPPAPAPPLRPGTAPERRWGCLTLLTPFSVSHRRPTRRG